jgi:hypothetical protein
MTMSASIAVIPADSYVPQTVEAELRLTTLSGSSNPLASGGTLEQIISGQGTSTVPLGSGTTTFKLTSILAVALPSRVTYVLQAPTGKQLLELELTVVDYTSSWSQDRVEVEVSAKGVSAAIAPSLTINPAVYSWRLSGVAATVGDTLKLGFELVQEQVPTESLDAQATTRLAFTSNGGGAQTAVIRVKRIKESPEPTP